jgi:hypothetical protein
MTNKLQKLIACCLFFTAATTLHAQNVNWNVPFGNWAVDTNWYPAHVPLSTENATIDNNGAAIVRGGTVAHANNLVIGDPTPAQGKGILTGTGDISANTVTVYSTGTLLPSDYSGHLGTMTINGNLTMIHNSTLHINYDELTSNRIVAVTGRAQFGTNLNVSVSSLANLNDLQGKNIVETTGGITTLAPSALLQLNGLPLGDSRASLGEIAVDIDATGKNLYVLKTVLL